MPITVEFQSNVLCASWHINRENDRNQNIERVTHREGENNQTLSYNESFVSVWSHDDCMAENFSTEKHKCIGQIVWPLVGMLAMYQFNCTDPAECAGHETTNTHKTRQQTNRRHLKSASITRAAQMCLQVSTKTNTV